MTAAPPFDAGAVNAIDAEALPAVATNEVGAPAVVRGVTDTAADIAPAPTSFTARNFTLYAVPLTNAVVASERIEIATGVVASVGLKAFHVVPLLVEY